MIDSLTIDQECRGSIVIVGETLGLFYLEDPEKGNASEAFASIKSLDKEAAAKEWPFVEYKEAATDLGLMQQGLVNHDFESLKWEYRRLFIGPNKKPAPPWGSVYTDREMVIFGESTLALRAWMRGQGIERRGHEGMPEDHIGFMLLMMAWIAEYRPEILKSYLSEHFFTWSSHFLGQLIDAAEQPFYEGLARLTKASLEGIQDELAISVQYPHFFR